MSTITVATQEALPRTQVTRAYKLMKGSSHMQLMYGCLAIIGVFAGGFVFRSVYEKIPLLTSRWKVPHDIKPMTVEGDFENLTGFWLGTVEKADLRVLLRITDECTVYLYSLDQGGALIPAGFSSKHDSTLSFWFPTIGGTYKATLQSNQDIQGKWTQVGRSFALTMIKYKGETFPREFEFLLRKSITGEAKKLEELTGYWSGYMADNPDEASELVVLQVENIGGNNNDSKNKNVSSWIEPKLWLPEQSPLPFPVQSLQVDNNNNVKIVMDYRDGNGDVNAVFEGQLSKDGKTIQGHVFYDDQDYSPPLKLVWSDHFPNLATVEKSLPTSSDVN